MAYLRGGSIPRGVLRYTAVRRVRSGSSSSGGGHRSGGSNLDSVSGGERRGVVTSLRDESREGSSVEGPVQCEGDGDTRTS